MSDRRPTVTRPAALTALAAGLALLPAAATPALAADVPRSLTMLDPGHPWSLYKVLGFVVTSALLWLICSRMVFEGLISWRRARAVWPRDAFARAVGLFSALTCLAFVVWFALASDALRGPEVQVKIFPHLWGNVSHVLNVHWLWILILGAGSLVSFAIYRSMRHPQVR